MYAIIDFFLSIFNNIVNILNIRIFSDINITYFQLILSCIAIKFVFKFLFGGFKEIDTGTNISLKTTVKGISNRARKEQIVNDNKSSNSGIVYRKDTKGNFHPIKARGNK